MNDSRSIFRHSGFVAAVIMTIASYFAVQRLKAGYEFTIRTPQVQIDQLPTVLGDWRGFEQPVNERTLEFVGATSQVNRVYTNSQGKKISLHAAVWSHEGSLTDVAPHHPLVCYPNAGWTVVHQEEAKVVLPGGGILPLSLITMERSGEGILTAHWYQMGSMRFTTRLQARDAHRGYWGRPEWPAVVKVLLQSSKTASTKDVADLKAFALQVHQWTRQLDN